MKFTFESGTEKHIVDALDYQVDSEGFVVNSEGERMTSINGETFKLTELYAVTEDENGETVFIRDTDSEVEVYNKKYSRGVEKSK